MTWDMVSDDVTTIMKTISKTAKSTPEPYVFDLTLVPQARELLLAVPREKRFGPIIRLADGGVPKPHTARSKFNDLLSDLDLPQTLRISDCRSGGITEASNLVDPMTLRNAAQHTNVSTTDRYVRGRSADLSKVVTLRMKNGS